ncbi:MAG: hypothetical protein P1U61_02500 [Legionellaceae bacterium]|nr:hypothetical protein [Legionellaceae bacterium]
MLDDTQFNAFCAGFELDISEAMQDNLWEEHYQKIKDLKAFAMSEEASRLTEGQQLDLACLLGLSAWAVGVKLKKQDENEALALITLSRKYFWYNWPLSAYIFYIESVIYLEQGKEQKASASALSALKGFEIAHKHVTGELRLHALNQYASALMQRNDVVEAQKVLFEAMDDISVTTQSHFTATNACCFNVSQIITTAEGPVTLRTYKNKANWHLMNEEPQLALSYASKSVDFYDPFKKPVGRADHLVFRAAFFLRMKKIESAFNDLKMAFKIYQTFHVSPHIDVLEALVALAETSVDVGCPNVYYLKQARLMQATLGLDNSHDLVIKLNAVPSKGTMADEHYLIAKGLLNNNRLTLFTSYQNKKHHANASLYPFCFLYKVLLSVACALHAAVLGCGQEMMVEFGSSLLNALNAVLSTLSLITRTCATLYHFEYSDEQLNLEKVGQEEKINRFEAWQTEEDTCRQTMALGI